MASWKFGRKQTGVTLTIKCGNIHFAFQGKKTMILQRD